MESRLRQLEDGRYEYTPKRGEAFVVKAAMRHLTSFHGV